MYTDPLTISPIQFSLHDLLESPLHFLPVQLLLAIWVLPRQWYHGLKIVSIIKLLSVLKSTEMFKMWLSFFYQGISPICAIWGCKNPCGSAAKNIRTLKGLYEIDPELLYNLRSYKEDSHPHMSSPGEK